MPSSGRAKKFYEELSPETGVFFNKMLDDELMDVLSTPGKAGGGYCTSLGDYEMPFILPTSTAPSTTSRS